MGNRAIWIVWVVISVLIMAYFAWRLLGDDDQTVFLPGPTSHGHYQIEMACGACHTDAFGGGEVLQEACMQCHAAELKRVDDSHPKAKFTDPRNADRVAKLDARQCVTCHVEHKPAITQTMGVTVPADFCFHCHQDIAEDRPSHTGMAFDTCASAGCHNFHDNTALYEDFLAKHLEQPQQLPEMKNLQRSSARDLSLLGDYPLRKYPLQPLVREDIDAPLRMLDKPQLADDWLASAHAAAGVNCSACHAPSVTGSASNWLEQPDHTACQSCHANEVQGFLESKHGMRLAQDLAPMQPAMARQPMHKDAAHKQLGCSSCHSAHAYDTQYAQVEACLTCHADQHSLAYKDSPHYAVQESDAVTTRVTCATCHLPKHVIKSGDATVVLTQHNQNDNLRPNEKMLRSVCMNCHGLGFAIDALADEKLILNNFNGMPSQHIESLDLVRARQKEPAREGGKM